MSQKIVAYVARLGSGSAILAAQFKIYATLVSEGLIFIIQLLKKISIFKKFFG